MFEISRLEFEKLQTFVQKQILCPEPKLSYVGVLGCNLKETIVILEINTFEFAEFQSFTHNEKTLNLGPKRLYFCTIHPEFEKKLLSYLKSTLSNLTKCKVSC